MEEQVISMAQERVRLTAPNARRDQRVLAAGAVLGAMTMALLVIIFGGDPFREARDILGLSYFMADERGVYADCSDPKNRFNSFCDKSRSKLGSTPTYERVSTRPKTIPFSLSD